MTERKPPGVSFESWVDRQIREAADRGAFDNLPGAGKPLPGLRKPRDEMWWIRQKLDQEGLSADTLLPEPIRLRKEIDRLPETVRPLPTEASVRDTVAALNRRIAAWLAAPSGPHIPVTPVDADEVVAGWRTARRRVPATPAVPSRKRRWWRRSGG